MHERLKWDNELACPHCGNLNTYKTNKGWKYRERE